MDEARYITFPSALAAINHATSEVQFGMASTPLVGALLRTLAASKPGGRFLELGTGTGISAAWILDGMDLNSTLVSVDVDEVTQDVARKALGDDTRLTLVLLDALEFLAGQPPASFDLVFADAMPGKYDGLGEALKVVKPGGFYVIDDMLPQDNWPEGHAAKVPVLLEVLSQNPNFEVVPMAWASGVVVAVRKSH